MKRFDWRKAVFIIYLAIVYLITVIRPWQPSVGFMQGSVNFTFFKEYIPFVKSRSWFMFIYLFVGNIVWFVPMGMLFRMFDRKKTVSFPKGLLWAVLKGLGISLSIEVLQFFFGKGLAEIDDLILNTFGVALGYCLFYLAETLFTGRKNKENNAEA